MADIDSETTESHLPKAKSKKVNFVLLKQILDDESIEITDSDEHETDNKGIQSSVKSNLAKKTPRDEECGPIGKYPVTFSKRCKSKSCQTRLSAFPLFSVPDDTEWISEDEENTYIKKDTQKATGKKKARKRRNSPNEESKRETQTVEKPPEKTKNADGSRKDFHSEHQLRDTKNPIIQAWIQSKNKLARKTKREERKERRAQRAALQEEERLKLERIETSDKKVKEWFNVKQKEARKLWRQNHPKISPFEMSLDDQTETSPPSPEYKIYKTFNENKPKQRNFPVKTCSRTATAVSTTAQLKDLSNNINVSNMVDKSPNKVHRPKTASYTRPVEKTQKPRPKTAKPTPKPEDAVSEEKSSKQMKSLSYDEWLKSKRELDKKKIVERRRELIDSHLNAVISKLGKQRVDNIMSPRKHVDTGLKNFSRNTTKTPSHQKKESYKWRTSHGAPRPEPQGCDCPESEHIDLDSKFNLSPSSPQRKANEFCKEVTEKCDMLKPSMDKVLAVLDTEMKKCSEKNDTNQSSKTPGSIMSTTKATCNDTENFLETCSVPGTVQENRSLSRPKSARPKSGKPNIIVNNTTLTTEEAKKKIFHDMDVLGLCSSDKDLGKSIATENKTAAMTTNDNHGNIISMTTTGDVNNNATMLSDQADVRSTVRSDYFDY